ncbi:helix-turn-helix transcriptional regulator [Mesorhizobium caraganae]|uniref:helix-turn-helix transcriptional regulator n=1 Tax=Mesorhizobium caraganae TaxID=483206 RepID=UPI003ED04EDD
MSLLNTKETAAKIRKSESWVNHARQDGSGPKYLKIGHQVRYRPEDVEAWLEQQARTRIWQFDEPRAA